MFEYLMYVNPKASNNGFKSSNQELNDQNLIKNDNVKSQYQALWQDVVDTIDQDPLVLEYKKKFPGTATSYVLNQLANHCMGSSDLSNKIIQMGRMHQAAVEMIKGDATLANAGHDQSNKESKMEIFLKNLNSINGKTYGIEKYQTNPDLAKFDGKSLMDLAYANGFDHVQNGPETLLTIRLGQLSKELVNKVQLIDNFTRIINLNNQVSQNSNDENQFDTIFSKIPGDNVEEYFQEQNRLEKEAKEIHLQAEQFYRGLQEISAQLSKDDKEEKMKQFLQKYDKELTQVRNELSKDNIKNAISNLEKNTLKHAEEYIKNQYVIRQSTKKENEILKQNYEKAVQSDQEIQKNMDRLLSEKDLKLHALDNTFEDIQKEIRTIQEQRAQKKYEKLSTIKAYEEKEKPLVERMNKLIDDAKTADIQSGILQSYMDDGTGDQLRDGMKEINERIDAMSEFDQLLLGIVDVKERRGDILNEALTAKDKSFDKVPSKATPETKEEYAHLKLIQERYNNLKAQHPEFKEYFDFIDEKRVKLGKPAKDGMAYDRFMQHLQKTGEESRQMYNEGKAYFDAIGFLENLNKRYNNKLPTMQDVQKLDDELSELRRSQPEKLDEEKFDAETKELLSSLKEKEEKISLQQDSTEKEYTQQYQSLRDQLQNPTEPTYAPVKSEEQIVKEAEDLKKRECNEKVKEQIRHEELNKISNKEVIEGLKVKVDKKREYANNIQNNVNVWKEKISETFKKGSDITKQYKERVDFYKEQVNQLGEGKKQFYKNVADIAGDYSKNMNQGMKKDHKNSKEFTAMADAITNVKTKYDRYTGKTTEGPMPTKQELLESLSNITQKADAYITKKNKGIHWIPSDQYFIRMDLANKLKQFGTDMTKQMSTMDQMEKSLQSYLANPPKVNTTHLVQEKENAGDYFKRQCKVYSEKSKNRKDLEKSLKKDSKEQTEGKKKETKAQKTEDNKILGGKGF